MGEEKCSCATEEDAQQELKDEKNRYLRLLADFNNFKKKTEGERDEIIKFSNEIFVMGLLPIIDNFERAIAASKSGSDDLIKGILLVKKQLEDTLSKLGVEIIESVGKHYDPHKHEAIMKKESEDMAENTVMEEMQKGYMFHGKVIRPSMVVVSTKKI